MQDDFKYRGAVPPRQTQLVRHWAGALALAAVACLLYVALGHADCYYAAQCVAQQEVNSCLK